MLYTVMIDEALSNIFAQFSVPPDGKLLLGRLGRQPQKCAELNPKAGSLSQYGRKVVTV